MRFTATILEAHRNALKQHLIRPDGLERVALLICGRCQTKRDPWTGDREERFISREVIAIPDDSLLEQSTTRVRFPTSYVYRAAKQVEPKDLALAIVHSHPNGELVYSEIDDRDEPEAMAIIFNRNDGVRPHLSLLMDGRGEMIGRAYGPDLKPVPLHMLRVIGDRFDFRHGDRELANLPHLDRQRRAFGKAFSNDMRALRFGIVGAGATGSATALLLMRLGAGHIAVFDPFVVDRTNLNRLHFARQTDADIGARKIDVLARQVSEGGLGVQVRGYADWIGSSNCRDALKACDVVFGCTDDHSGRNLLNRLAYFYGIPVIDMGIRMELDDDGESFRVLDGRVTALMPGATCLHCRGLVNGDRMRAESLLRNDPDGYERERRAGYLPEEGDPAPAVVTFTTETACMAVNELIQRLHGFRGPDGSWNERVRQFHVPKDFDIRAGKSPREGCRICENTFYWGRGDMEPFLDVVG